MKPKLFVLLILSTLAFCFHCKAQNANPAIAPDLQEKAAGFELVKASKHFYSGTVLEYSGGLAFIIGSAEIGVNNNGAGNGLVLLGGLAFIAGTCLTIESYSHIGRAGKILIQRNSFSLGPTPYGVGLSFRF